MSERIKQALEDLHDIKQDVNEIKVDVAKNSTSLDLHMQRTELNESRIKAIETFLLGTLMTAVVGLLIKLFS